MIERMIRAAKLDINLYEEAEHETRLTNEAMTVVIIVAVLGTIGSIIAGVLTNAMAGADSARTGGGIGFTIIASVVTGVWAVVGWGVWSWLTYFIGTRLFNGTATWGELLRTIGYSYSPRVLDFLVFIPCVGPILSLAGNIWSLVAGVIAVRQALDFDTGKAIVTVIIGWLVQFVITMIILSVLGAGALISSAAIGG